MRGPLMLQELERRVEDDRRQQLTDAEPRADGAGRPMRGRSALVDRALVGFFVLFMAVGFLLFVIDLLIP